MRTIPFLLILALVCSCSTKEQKEHGLGLQLLSRVEKLAASPQTVDRQDAAALIEEGAYLFSDFPSLSSRVERTLAALKSDRDRVVRGMSNAAEAALIQARKSRE